ncbi:rhodanese-like domain-containing protein [Maribacter sp. HTCC2170]|uniref:rhodanese-like domain-containing protein n=1 Tax=Maribacter sp. (strain HTCC2170 / KCCM 42371) TaxID=313603 RepID=UPI00006AFCDC|nr:rhodanese-like domain-containing protein [Maribacter sp. HTCC2170]EAR01348.1 hypothetical protein FB2170_11526 [Maribacter sp. HTCC2170]
MKELEKTKRISISTVLFILIIVIGFLTFRKPTNVYGKTQLETLEILKTKDYLVAIPELKNTDNVLIDVRSRFDFDKSHISDAINIPTAEILDAKNIELFKKFRENNIPVIIYGKDPIDANSAWMILYELGFDNAKLLGAQTALVDNELKVQNYEFEKPIANYVDIFKKEAPKKTPIVKKVVKRTPKKVVPIKKKKKKKPEGGC